MRNTFLGFGSPTEIPMTLKESDLSGCLSESTQAIDSKMQPVLRFPYAFERSTEYLYCHSVATSLTMIQVLKAIILN